MSMLRNLRERKGLTVSQLAAKASIPSRVITDYEEGRATLTLAHAKLLAKSLWVGIEDLMPPVGAVPPQAGAPAPAQTTAPRPSPATPPAPPTPRPAPPLAPAAQQPAYRPEPEISAERPPQAPEAQPRDDTAQQRPLPSRPTNGSQPRTWAPGRGVRPPRPPAPTPGPITEGQLEELQRLAAKLEITQEQLEVRIGKQLAGMNRSDAKEWIKRARGMVEEIIPNRKIAYGQWPEARQDQEAAYLQAQQEAGSFFLFKLFNGEQFEGVIADFTPYTITVGVRGSGGEIVLRKLAIAYYRRAEAPIVAPAKPRAKAKTATAKDTVVMPTLTPTSTALEATTTEGHNHARDDHHQPLDTGIDSDHVGEPARPETDQMDEDRGL